MQRRAKTAASPKKIYILIPSGSDSPRRRLSLKTWRAPALPYCSRSPSPPPRAFTRRLDAVQPDATRLFLLEPGGCAHPVIITFKLPTLPLTVASQSPGALFVFSPLHFAFAPPSEWQTCYIFLTSHLFPCSPRPSGDRALLSAPIAAARQTLPTPPLIVTAASPLASHGPSRNH
jgi:hypothetical protein